MSRYRHVARSRLTWGIVLLVVGAVALAVNLGLSIPRDWWDYWPALLIILGGAQLFWPGSPRERLSGYWLLAVGIYGWISVFELFGLHWGTSWPILIVALGLRIILGGFFNEWLDRDRRGKDSAGGAP